MIKGYCTPNNDNFSGRFNYPEKFCAVPQRGERVGSFNGGQIWYVANVTHLVDMYGEPYIEVELVDFNGSINNR